MSDRHQLTDSGPRAQGSDVEPGGPVEEKAPRRRRGRRIALIVLLVVVLLTGGAPWPVVSTTARSTSPSSGSTPSRACRRSRAHRSRPRAP
nr:hypothetical protein [Micromonospora provocatoris]